MSPAEPPRGGGSAALRSRANVVGLVLLAIVLGSGCSGPSSPQVTIGTTVPAFTELREGDPVTVTVGPEAAYILFVGFQARNVDLNVDWEIDISVLWRGIDISWSSGQVRKFQTTGDGAVAETSPVIVFLGVCTPFGADDTCPEIRQVLSDDVTLRYELTDGRGTTVGGQVRVDVACLRNGFGCELFCPDDPDASLCPDGSPPPDAGS